MKIGIRTPSLKRRLAARLSVKRFLRHNLKLKAPRGLGLVTDPQKAIYNKIYNKTSLGVEDVVTKVGKLENKDTKSFKPLNAIVYTLLVICFFPFSLIYLVYKYSKTS